MVALISVFFFKLDYKITHVLFCHLKNILWIEKEYDNLNELYIWHPKPHSVTNSFKKNKDFPTTKITRN